MSGMCNKLRALWSEIVHVSSKLNKRAERFEFNLKFQVRFKIKIAR